MLFVNEIICTHVLPYYYAINIDYYMAFFISYPLSAREPIWKIICYDMFIIYFNRGNNWFVPKCLVILARIIYMYIVTEHENYCFNIQIQ